MMAFPAAPALVRPGSSSATREFGWGILQKKKKDYKNVPAAGAGTSKSSAGGATKVQVGQGAVRSAVDRQHACWIEISDLHVRSSFLVPLPLARRRGWQVAGRHPAAPLRCRPDKMQLIDNIGTRRRAGRGARRGRRY
jgi:hypothetical protein